MEAPSKRWIGRVASVPWFVLAWLAPASYIGLRSLAALGSAEAALEAPASVRLIAPLAASMEWPLPMAILAAAVWAFLGRHRPAD